ncbi:GPI mannosyltransferase 4 [Rhinatrema bivittatum]|uniref:GPI mannosyltransferase 4 n=1 Tax=Rhinatrema bivittatum TaxID=194408 RepID=UPI0011281C68|nr:GPI mannosyltransferase 4 [Rhinatrema bivittatum]
MSGPVSSRCSWRAVPGLAAALRVARQERSAGESSEPRAGEKFITLERVSEGGDEPPCFLYLQCDPRGKEEILSLTVISQARNMEIYAKEEEYVGTSRGEVYLAASDSGNGTVTFYRKFLKMESPTPACKVKLLSHGGKERLLLRNITVELTASTVQCPRSFPPLGTSIDLGRVQTMMDCMGCKLSPGAQQLLSMVQHQQKQNLFPLGIQLQGLGCVCREGQLPGSGTAPRKGSSWTLPQADDFAALVSSVLEKQASGSSDLARTDLLPFLQNLCGQVNHMRIEERSAGHEPETRSEEHTMNLGCCELLMGPKVVWSLLSLLRFLWCLLPQTGFLHPDEFFQSAEVMAGDILHLQVFRPWEFLPSAPCRSVVFPFITSGISFWVIQSLQQLGILTNPPSSYVLLVLPRLSVTLASFLLDLCVYRVAQVWGAERWPALALLAGSYVTAVFYTRTWSNAVEGVLFALLLLLVSPAVAPGGSLATPVCSRAKQRCLLGVLLMAGFFNRPTFPAFALVPVLCWAGQGFRCGVLPMLKEWLWLLPSAAATAALFIVADSLYFAPAQQQNVSGLSFAARISQNAVFTPLNFLRYNLNSCHLAQHGAHPRLCHLLLNGMLLFGILHLSAVTAAMKACLHGLYQLAWVKRTQQMPPPSALLLFYFVPLALLSLFSHQEPRFLIPLILPLVLFSAAGRKTMQTKSAILCFNVCGALFFGVLHQGGLVPALSHLQQILHSESQQNTTSRITLLFSHTYMPPRFLLGIPQQNLLVDVVDLAGAEEQVLCRKLSELGHSSCCRESGRPALLKSESCRLLVITPGTVQPTIKKCGFPVERESSWFPHLSLEDPPRLASLYDDNWRDLLGLHILQVHN